jgi:putative endonuclease
MDGADAESRALSFLQGQGLKLVARNWRCKAGELDLVMRDADTVVITEVRQRSRDDYGFAAETVDGRKQLKLARAARLWLAQRPEFADAPLRFDVVALDGRGNIDWIREAFEAGD